MKRLFIFLGILFGATLACFPASPTTRDASAVVTTFVDESGKGTLTESYQPLPDTLVIANWNVHGVMYREVKFTDQNGKANISVGYTHYFDISVLPPCGYYSTTPLIQDMTKTEKTQFGFWPADPGLQLSRVKVLVWKDLNSNGTRDSQEEVLNGRAGIIFKIPSGMGGTDFNEDNFIQETDNGWFDINLGNSCGSIYMLWLNGDLSTNSVSEPGKVSDIGNGTPSIEIPYKPGETTIYWEMK